MRSVSGEEYDPIVEHQLGPIPEPREPSDAIDAGEANDLTNDSLDFPFGYNVATTEEEIPW